MTNCNVCNHSKVNHSIGECLAWGYKNDHTAKCPCKSFRTKLIRKRAKVLVEPAHFDENNFYVDKTYKKIVESVDPGFLREESEKTDLMMFMRGELIR